MENACHALITDVLNVTKPINALHVFLDLINKIILALQFASNHSIIVPNLKLVITVQLAACNAFLHHLVFLAKMDILIIVALANNVPIFAYHALKKPAAINVYPKLLI